MNLSMEMLLISPRCSRFPAEVAEYCMLDAKVVLITVGLESLCSKVRSYGGQLMLCKREIVISIWFICLLDIELDMKSVIV